MTRQIPFTKPNVIKMLQDRKDNIVWRQAHLPLADSLRKKLDDDLTLIESIQSEIREMFYG